MVGEGSTMRLPMTLVLACALALPAQIPPAAQSTHPGEIEPPSDDIRLPNGKSQRDEILKAEYQKSLEDARELSRLADDLKLQIEKNDRYVLSLATLKKTEEI